MFNLYGLYILFAREVWRFLKVSIQTILTPVITVLLYLLIFSSIISRSREMLPGVNYLTFLIPGLMVMLSLCCWPRSLISNSIWPLSGPP